MKSVFVASLSFAVLFGWVGRQSAHAQLTPPEQAYVLQFGSNTISTAPMSAALELTASFTMEAWVNLQSGEPFAVLLGKPHDPRGEDPYMDYTIGLDETGKLFEFQMSTGAPGTYRSARAPASIMGEWVHVAAVHDEAEMRLLINGDIVATTPSPGNPDNTSLPFGVGAGAQQGDEIVGGFTGTLRQVRVWNRALSAEELAAQAGSALTGSEEGLAAYWPLDDGAGDTARDLGPSDLHLQLGTDAGVDASDPTWVDFGLLENPVFTATTYETPVGYTDPSWVRLLDYDTDGDLDAVLTQLKWPPSYPDPRHAAVVAMSNDDGVFVDRTDEVIGEAFTVHARAFALADFTGDARTDLFIADHGTDMDPFPGEQNGLFIQSENGRLVNVSGSHLPPHTRFTHSTAAADIDVDGDVDLFVGEMDAPGPQIYLNDGSGRFTATTSGLPSIVANLQEVYTSAAFVDVDKDGDPDLILGDEGGTYNPPVFAEDALLLNDGSGRFTFAPEGAIPPRTGGSEHGTIFVSSSDFDGDGWPDLMLSNMRFNYVHPSLQLLLNNGDGTFRDATDQVEQQWPDSDETLDWLEEIHPADFNGDGWMDVLVTSRSRKTRLFLNRGGADFEEASEALPVSFAEAAYPGDLDGDGDVDVFGVVGRTPVVLWNERPYRAATTPLPAPGAPVLSQPGAGESVTGPVQLDWTDVEGSTHYEVVVASDADLNNVVRHLDGHAPSGVEMALPSSGTYYWRVRAVNTAGSGAWSAIGEVTVASGVASEPDADLPASFALHLAYPNPFNPSVTISYDVPKPAHVRLAVYDALGREISVLVDGTRSPGRHAATWEPVRQASGVYLYRFESGSFVRTGRVVLSE